MYDQIDVSSLCEPDPNWVFVDAAGHCHTYSYATPLPPGFNPAIDDPSPYEPRTPTLREVSMAVATDEYPAVTRHICRECGERIAPGTRPSPVPRYLVIRKHSWTA